MGPNAVNMRYSYRGKGGAGDDFKMYYTAHGSISATTTVDGSKVGKDTPVGEGWHTAAWYAKTPITSRYLTTDSMASATARTAVRDMWR